MSQTLLRAAPNRPNRTIPVSGRKPLQVAAGSSRLLDDDEAAAVEAWRVANPGAAKDYTLTPQVPRVREPQAEEVPAEEAPRRRRVSSAPA